MIALVTSLSFFCWEKSQKPDQAQWNAFRDSVNGWHINYPASITTVELADDDGPKNWLDNIVFEDNERWVFSIFVAATSSKDTGITSLSNPDRNEKGFMTVRSHKAFIIRTNSDAPAEKILSSLETEE